MVDPARAVSVVIPAYNAAKTIAETLESVLRQTYLHWEAIVIDDGSTDATGRIARRYVKRDPRIRMFSQANGGESAARNTGVCKARYEWLAFVDADDWIAPGYMQRMMAEIAGDAELDAVHCGSVRVAADGTQVSDGYRPPAGDLFPILARRAAFPVNACLVRRSIVLNVGNFDTSLKKSPDWDLWQRVARYGARFGSVPEVLAFYRMTPNSASLEAEQLFIDGLRVLKRGYAPDPRVPSPHPDHTEGLRGSTVESQEFYLLSWSAGLLIGSGKDPRHLLTRVEGDHYPDLYPNAIAQCVFEAATLPNCRSREAWEKMWPEIQGLARDYFMALEKQSQTPDLAYHTLQELKRLVLAHSLTWSGVIARDQHTIARQKDLLDQQDRARVQFENERDALRQMHQQSRQDRAILESERETARRQIQYLEQEHDRLKSDLEAVRGRISGLESDRARLEEEKTNLAASLAAAQHRAEVVAQALDASHDRIKMLESGALAAQERQVELASALNNSREHRAELEGALHAAREHAGEVESALATVRQRAQKLEEEKTKQGSDLADAQRLAEAAEERETELVFALNISQGRCAELESTLDAASQKGAELEGALHAAREHAGEVKSELAAVRERARELEQEKTNLVSGLEAAVRETEQRERVMKHTAEALEAELNGWEQSTAQSRYVAGRFEKHPWVRVGLRLGILERPADVPQLPELSEGESIASENGSVSGQWQLRAAPGNVVYLTSAPGLLDSVRIVVRIAGTTRKWDVQLNQAHLRVEANRRYVLRFRARADRPRTIGVGLAMAHDPWTGLGLYSKVVLFPEWQSFTEEFVAGEDDDNARIHFDVGGLESVVEVAGVTLVSLPAE